MKENSIKNRYDFVILFDVTNGNPNGDPDAGNLPRIDSDTNLGIVTDVCLKRKIRNYVDTVKEDCERFNILIKNNDFLNNKFKKAHEEIGSKGGKKGSINKENADKAKDFMCNNYYDVRTFGAVMSTGDYSCGTVTGPVQITFARTIDPIFSKELTITRQALTSEADKGKDNTMGKKNIVPYGLYRAEGFISANISQKTTGFDEEDLHLLWEAIINMFEHDRSAARGMMATRKLYVFKHDSKLGNAPAHKLFEKIKINKKQEVNNPRSFSDYTIEVNENMPEGVELTQLI